MDAVRAIGICDVDSNGDPKFSVKATWVLADGLPPGPDVDMAKYHLGHGLVDPPGSPLVVSDEEPADWSPQSGP